MKHFYTGIGSRQTPAPILMQMRSAAVRLSQLNWILRSGGAVGADTAFESGSELFLKEIYLPWRGFNGNASTLFQASPELTAKALTLAEQFHPAWDRCSPAARKMHARNCHQILGQDLNTPSSFVCCWTKDGKATGGTGQALRMAEHYEIPIVNFYNPLPLHQLAAVLRA